jgi:hypothetical protein
VDFHHPCCPHHDPLESIRCQLDQILARLSRTETNQETIMTALDNLAAADTALKAEVVQAIADWQAALAAAGSANDPAIQAVADDMSATVAQLQAADPATVPPVDSGDGSTPPDDGSAPAAS